jgi:hypothetical protein
MDTLYFVWKGCHDGKTGELTFKHRIEKGDYETFYNIVHDFFTADDVLMDVVGGEEEVFKLFPSLKGQFALDFSISINELFGRHYVVEGVECIQENIYKIQYGT